MFGGEDFVTFSSRLSGKELLRHVESPLEMLGHTSIDNSGNITITPKSRFNGLFSNVSIEGKLRTYDDKFKVSLEYDATLSVFGWIVLVLGILIYLLGVLVLFSPMSEKKS